MYARKGFLIQTVHKCEIIQSLRTFWREKNKFHATLTYVFRRDKMCTFGPVVILQILEEEEKVTAEEK
jgi:hypothetical protein